MTREKFTGRQAFAAGFLQFTEGEGSLATGDDDGVALDGEDAAGLSLAGMRTRLPQFEALAGERGLGAGKRVEGTDLTVDVRGALLQSMLASALSILWA